MHRPFLETLIFFSKIAFSCLALELLFEKYCDFNKIPTILYPSLQWFSNFMIYYPYSYLLTWLKNSDYLESRKVKHPKITKKWPQFNIKGMIYGELFFFLLCNIYGNIFKNEISSGNIFDKLGWFYLCIFSADLLFYPIHYCVLHIKFFYLHKQHHQEIDLNGFSSEIKSLYESIIVTLSDVIVFIILGRDMNQFLAWVIIGVLYNVEGHSTLKLFFIHSDFHLNHHFYVECNYGSGFYLDYIFGTTYKYQN